MMILPNLIFRNGKCSIHGRTFGCPTHFITVIIIHWHSTVSASGRYFSLQSFCMAYTMGGLAQGSMTTGSGCGTIRLQREDFCGFLQMRELNAPTVTAQLIPTEILHPMVF